jgi:hypothetical protein
VRRRKAVRQLAERERERRHQACVLRGHACGFVCLILLLICLERQQDRHLDVGVVSCNASCDLCSVDLSHELRSRKRQGIILKLDFEKAYDKVHWGFMFEVLKKKNFPQKWLEWMKQIIEGGQSGNKH